MKNSVLNTVAPALFILGLLIVPASAQTAVVNHSSTPWVIQTATSHAQKHASFVENRITDLHAKLRITDKQSKQWDAYAKTMRDNASSTDKSFQDRSQKLSSMNADDAMKSYAELAQLHAKNMEKLASSFDTLYGTFSDEQKKIADKLFQNEQANRHGEMHKSH
ncbi:Spy/CpxP family protein refolding chaperone [Neisseriaceae bacterium JH1-16]|nr:Spy/CpxP family protein refolding chaperone [Neisseriaceae bacterium JH1-16]